FRRNLIPKGPGPEPALADGPSLGVHPEATPLIDPLDDEARQPGPRRVEGMGVLVQDEQHPPRSEDAPQLAQSVGNPSGWKVLEDLDGHRTIEDLIAERQPQGRAPHAGEPPRPR